MVAGRVVFRARDTAMLHLEETGSSGRFKKPDMNLRLVSIEIDDRQHPVMTKPHVIKGGIIRTKTLGAGTRLDFELTSPVKLPPRP
jgi:hypothetical protein